MLTLLQATTDKLVIAQPLDEQIDIDMTKSLADVMQIASLQSDQFHGELVAQIQSDNDFFKIYAGKDHKEHDMVLLIDNKDHIQQLKPNKFIKTKHFPLFISEDVTQLVLGRPKHHQKLLVTANVLL